MNFWQRVSSLGIIALAAAAEQGMADPAPNAFSQGEANYWPLSVSENDTGTYTYSEQGLGPLLFSQQKADGSRAEGFRPFYVTREWPQEGKREVDVLYPLFTYRADQDRHSWSFLQLINRKAPQQGSQYEHARSFDLWPVFFSKRTGDPATSYVGVFPVAGTMKNRFGNDRADWFLFPLYGRFQKGEKVVHTTPWPFIKTIEGGGHHGWAVWPLYGNRTEEGKSRSQFFLWPLGYRNSSNLNTDKPATNFGFLPFYAESRNPDSASQTFVWPFFGYIDRKAPTRYHETHYFWPLFVQGRGDVKYRNRWAPFYTHSTVKGYDKTWVLWPVYKQEKWTDRGLDQTRTSFLFFVYKSLEQRKAGQPENAPMAEKTHLWPLLSAWDNGAGKRQLQVLSPLEVFFPENETVRLTYSPLFALYRYDEQASGVEKHTLLWNAISYSHNDSAGTRYFRLGPLASYDRHPEGRRIALLCGLLGLKRGADGHGWRPFAFDFSNRVKQPAP